LPADSNLLVGLTTGDDAGVYRIDDRTAIVQTVDFFTPIVDDPYTFGQIAAANSLSDVYAMGGRPITVMNIVCFPIADRGAAELTEILRGGADKVAESGAALVGGHSVEDPEPKFGLSVTGLVDPSRIATNAGAQAGDAIVLTKPLGTGIITTAAKFDECPPDAFTAACRSMAALNAAAAEAMREVGIGPDKPIHAVTDITGFALLGHLFHLARASGVGIEIDSSALPLLPEVERLAAAGYITRGGKENEAYLSNYIDVAPNVSQNRLSVMLDPQTSGGLAICVTQSGLSALLTELRSRGVSARAVIGRITQSGAPRVSVK
jgi:selenide,water dikinase